MNKLAPVILLVTAVAALLINLVAVFLRRRHEGRHHRKLRVGEFVSRRFSVLVVIILLAYAAVFYAIKHGEQERAIETFQKLELHDARQMAQNLEREIRIIQAQMRVIARNGCVSHFDEMGKQVLRSDFKMLDSRWIRGLSRVSTAGHILFTTPNESLTGADISTQSHNQLMLRKRAPLVGGPFDAIQKYKAIAVMEPVFDSKGIDTGWLTALIDFKALVSHFTRPTAAGGLARAGLMDHAGRSLGDIDNAQNRLTVSEAVSAHPELQSAIQRIAREEDGFLRYKVENPAHPGQSVVRTGAFARIHLGPGLFWVTLVTADEAEILDSFPVALWPEAAVFILFLAMIVLAAAERLRDEHRYAERLESEISRRMEELRRSEEAQVLLAHAVEQSAEATFLVDTRGCVQYVNPAFTTLTGLHPSRIVGHRAWSIIRDRRAAATSREILIALSSGEAWSGGLVNRRRDGTLYEVEAVFSPVRDAAGKILQYVSVNRDVTLEHALEAQLRQSQKMEAIGKLAGGVAHDFNNVLTAIVGNIQLAQRLADQRLQKYLRDALTASERATELVRQLLAFSRKSSGVRQLVEVNSLVRETANFVEQSIDRRIRLITSLTEDLPRIKADPNQIHQVIMNLCLNARDATIERMNAAGGYNAGRGREYRILVQSRLEAVGEDYCRLHSFAHPGRFVVIMVCDDGVGMDHETLARVFEPFFTTKGEGKGTGLGLSTVYGIVKSHNGWVHVASEPDAGAVFKVYFPISEAPALAEKKVAI